MEAEGYAVAVDTHGLGAPEVIVSLFFDHLREAAVSHGFLE
jgi:cobalamin biosynthesis Co2+ chelatase CbiK